ncbi:arginine--tRNA ligase [Candidatus Uhrbacteria bacterium]|nr:arginine--tRNA ligase [Candidatus Uhrbacteria bacterium]
MMIRDTIQKNIFSAIVAAQKEGALPVFSLSAIPLEHPDTVAYGDYTTSIALQLAKSVGKPPRAIAECIVTALQKQHSAAIDRIEIADAGFINMWLSEDWLRSTVQAIVQHPKTFARRTIGKGKRVIVELSSVNIAKEMNIGHFRSNIIGDALAFFYEALGYKVIRDNHLGDWGTQFGKLIVATRQWIATTGKTVDDVTLPLLMQLYVQFHKDAENDPALDDAARRETKKLQDGDQENRKLWKRFVALSLAEFQSIYDRLGTKFDTMHGESFYNDMLAGVVADARTKGVAKESEGALIIPFETLPPAIIQKSDGAFNYATTDLATIQYRAKTYKPFRTLYCVANEQALHFNQLFAAATALGYKNTGELVHVKFGMALGADGKKFSTRRGETIRLLDVMNEAVARARRLVTAEDMTEKEKDAIAEIVGIGALKYNDLSQNRVHDITFDWDRMLSITGNSAPYLQYVAVRIRGILEKAPQEKGRGIADAWTDEERMLARLLYRFSEVIEDAANAYEPHRLAEYLFELAQAFHRFYDKVSVLKADPATRNERLHLITAVRHTIIEGLRLLGIGTPERM